jgi:hypothetical protein
MEAANLREINDLLLDSFKQRVQDAGIPVEKSPVLRSVS